MTNKRQDKFLFGSYDFSNSGYVLMFQSFLFPLVLAAASNAGEARSQAVWAWIVTTSSILAICSAPFIGRLADHLGKTLVFSITVIVTGVLASLSPLVFSDEFILLAICFVVFNTIFELTQSLYDSFLLNFERSSKEIMALSSFGWGFGYLGGALFAISYLIMSKGGVSPSISLSILGLLYLILSLFPVLRFRRIDTVIKKQKAQINIGEILKTSSPVPWRELLIYWVIADTVAAVLYFAPLYMRQEIGINTQTLGGLFLGAQLLAFPATILMGRLANRTGAIKVVRWCLLIWFGSILGLYFARSLAALIPVMIALSFVIGSTQAILRAHFASRIELKRSGEGLGYFAIAQKSASVIAPAIVGGLSLLTGTLRPSFLLLAFFILLAFLLAFRLSDIPSSSKYSEEKGAAL